MKGKKILLLEDDSSLGLTLKERLEKDGFEVLFARSLSEARGHLEQRFDLVILDVGLPDGSGFDFANEVKKVSSAPFLFVTAQGDAESRLQGYESGAEEYIPKPFHLKEFLMRVNHVLQNHSTLDVFSPSKDLRIDFSSFRVMLNENGRVSSQNLAQKEASVLKHLIQSSPKVISRDELLNLFWGEENFPTQRTVDNVIVKLRSMLGERYGAFIHSVRGVGYQWLMSKGSDQ